MISRSPSAGHGVWRSELRAAARAPATLAAHGAGEVSAEAHALFPTRVPAEWLDAGLPAPLLAQVLPDSRENEPAPGYGPDPVGDLAAQVAPGVLHKYEGRVLLVATGACPIHCRYCFRRHFPYSDALAARDRWRAALAYIAAHDDVREVILSGGDPLTLATDRLRELTAGVTAISHVRRLRVHSRTPVVVPSRIDDALVAWLRDLTLPTALVLHVNHARELTDRACAALARLRETGVTLLNQAVLLAGVNDSVDAQAELAEALFAAGVLPYYLHLLDPVAGARHFEVGEATARTLMGGLHARLPGYLLPRLVRELPGESGKRPIAFGMPRER